MPTATTPATRLSAPELGWLLALRPGAASELLAAALGLSETAPPVEPPESLRGRGMLIERNNEALPTGDAAIIGEALTGAHALIRVGTADAIGAVFALGAQRTLVIAPMRPCQAGSSTSTGRACPPRSWTRAST